MGKSSKDKRDAYYRLAKEQGWRARSAFKLLQLDEEFNLFEGVTRVVDLCAAPGSWSQVLSRVLIKGEKFGRVAWLERRARLQQAADSAVQEDVLPPDDTTTVTATATDAQKDDVVKIQPRKDVKIVAIDLQPMSSLEGIVTMRADITHPSTVPKLLAALEAPTQGTDSAGQAQTTHHVDLVLTDGAPDVTGLHDLDIYIQSSLLRSALALAMRVLRPGGTFVAKIFRGKDCDLLYAQLRCVFESVVVAKPRASRASSLEAFVVARGFRVPSAAVLRELEIEEAAGVTLDTADSEESASIPKRERTKPYRRTREDGIIEVELGSSDDEAAVDETGQSKRTDRWVAPFLRCGDLSPFDYDADATYHLPPDHVVLDPVQPPTAPPYKKAVEERRRLGGFYGKTKYTTKLPDRTATAAASLDNP